MKRGVALSFLFSTLFISQLFAQSSVTVFGPRVFERSTGQPVTVVVNFSVGADAISPFVMHLMNGKANGDNRVSSATIKLNGTQIFSPSDFNQQVYQIDRSVTLTGNNILEVRLASKPGSYLTLNITANSVAAPVITIYTPPADIITSQYQVTVTGKVEGIAGTMATINNNPLTLASDGTFSAIVPLTIEGTNPIMVKAITPSGVESECTRTVIRDTQAPVLTVTVPQIGQITDSLSTQVRGTVNDPSPVTLKVNNTVIQYDSLGIYATQSALNEGLNTITVTATDDAGNQTTVTRIIRRDTQAPILNVQYPKNDTITNQQTINVSGTVLDSTSIKLTVNGELLTVSADGTFNYDLPIVEGLNTITIIATDTVGNKTTVTRTVRRDTGAPVVNLASPADSLITNQLSVTVSGTVLDSTAVTLTINGNIVPVGLGRAFSYPLTLVQGMNAITILATDAATNQTTVIRHVNLHSIPPELAIEGLIDSTITKDTLITIQGKVSGLLPVILTVNGSPVSIGPDSTFSLQLILQEGINTIAIIATDAVGNITTVNRTIWRDTQTPQLTITSFEDGMVTNQSSLTVQGSVSDLTMVTLTINGSPVTINPDGTFSHQLTLAEGKNTITIVATDNMENHIELVRTVRLDTKAPIISIISLKNNIQTADSIIMAMGSVGDSTNITLTINGIAQTLSADGGFSAPVFLSYGSNNITFVATDQTSNITTITKTVIRVPLPPDPVSVAPQLDMTVGTLVMDATEFLYTGTDPIQKEVEPGTINKLHITILKGRVLNSNLQPLSGVKVTILGEPELGYTFTREDGQYDMAVNGGGEIKVNFSKPGYLPAQRQISTSWATYANVDEVALLPIDKAAHLVDFTQPEIVQGTSVSDSLGTRKPTLFFEQGTKANLVFTKYNYKIITGCSSKYSSPVSSKIIPISLDSLVEVKSVNVRTTEYTVGPNAELLIPTELPQTVAYTFAFELSADEMLSTGARDIRFDQPVSLYLENVMNFPVGLTVPMGCLNKQTGFWETSDNGKVIKILDTTGGIVAIDYNGDNIADPVDTLIVRGISLVEQQYIASVYSPGQSIWRAEITHFGTYAGGFSMIAPNAKDPQNPLPDRYAKVDRDNIMAGSVIGVQNQTLGESIPITNTSMTMHYKSDRVFGRREAYCLDIPLTGKTIPQGMSEVKLEIEIFGRKIDSTFTPQPNLTHHFEWDGKDAYGRRVQGQQNILTQITYSFPAKYTIPPDVKRCFATPSGQIMEQYIPARKEIRRTQVWEGKIGAFDILSLGIGGWSLSLHHGYDCVGRILYKGTGEVRSANVMDNVINTIAGKPDKWINQKCTSNIDGLPAVQTEISVPLSLRFSSDGTLYYGDYLGIINMIDSAGIINTIAGRLGGCSTGLSDTATGIMANCASLGFDLTGGSRIVQGLDKSWYVADANKNVIWRISPEGEITRFAGVHYDNPNGNLARFEGDGGPAIDAYLNRPGPLALGKDGCLYVSDLANYRIRKISPDGIITSVAGGGTGSDGGPAILCGMSQPRGLAVAPDGSIFFCDYSNRRIRKITPDGIIRTFAGVGYRNNMNTGDGGLALQAEIVYSSDICVAKDGTVFFNSSKKVRAVATDGYIKTIVGGGNTFWVNNGPATSTDLGSEPKIIFGPDDDLYVGDWPWVSLAPSSISNPRIFKVTPPLPGITLSEILVASEDGSERYVFTYSGRHLRTLDALTGVTKYTFGYNSRYKLVTITDIDSLVTRIERDSSDNALAVISPYGVRTNITVDSLGYLVQATNSANESNQFTVTTGGLMTSKTDPRGNTYHFEYDTLGYLTRDADPAGGYTNLTRMYDSTGYTITATTAMGKVTKYRAEKTHDGTRRFINTDPNGLKTITIDSTDGSSYTITSDGMNTPIKEKADPRFGMQSPLINATVKTPGGIQSNVNQFRTITQMTGTAVTGLQDSIMVNGKAFKTVWDGNQRMLTKISAEGRKTFFFYDAKGRIVKDSIPGLLSTTHVYNAIGRKIEDNQGGRKTTYEYDTLGRQTKVIDPYGRSTQFFYDLGDRLTKTIFPDLSEVLFTYDHNGNMLSLTPPSKPEHTFGYSKLDLETLYTPPFAGDSARTTAKTYNFDKEITRIARPDSLNLDFIYGGKGSLAGQPKNIVYDRGTMTFLYDTLKGFLTGIISPNGDSLLYQYDGQLPKNVRWTGSVNGNIKVRYNNDMKVLSETVNNIDSVNFVYDNDGLLTSAGTLKLRSTTLNNLLLSDTLGNIGTNYTYNPFGEIISQQTQFGSTIIYQVNFIRDSLGKITEKAETVRGISTKYNYVYDMKGQLIQASKNDTVISEYLYNANGNRVAHVTSFKVDSGFYDAQDRLLRYGDIQYFYSQNGDLKKKVQGVDTTYYDYDAMGNLLSVALPNGSKVEYNSDGAGRRIVRKINGQITQRWLYSDDLRISAEVDSAGNVVSHFVYATKRNVPDCVLRSGIAYRVVTDQVGSARQVINTQNGSIVQQIDYDEFGNVINSIGQQIIPMGFAGGIYDIETKIVKYGVRDYDASTGRWLTKDPIGFDGGNENLYLYASNDPIDKKDPTGNWASWDHFLFTWIAMEASGYSTAEALITAFYSMKTDIEYGGKEFSPYHSMRLEGQSIESAKSTASSFVKRELGEGTYEGLGNALHTIQDAECSQHAWNVWDPKNTGQHFIDETFHELAIFKAMAVSSSIQLIKQWNR
jgi:RHS repeat-associated protein